MQRHQEVLVLVDAVVAPDRALAGGASKRRSESIIVLPM